MGKKRRAAHTVYKMRIGSGVVETETVLAVRHGEWFLYRQARTNFQMRTSEVEHYYVIAHRCGLAAYQTQSPVEAARIMRAMQSMPPMPVDDETFRAMWTTAKYPEHVSSWRDTVLRAMQRVANDMPYANVTC